MDSMFAGGINCVGGSGDQSRHRAHIDNMTRALPDHHRQSLTRGLHHAQDIDIKLCFNIFLDRDFPASPSAQTRRY